MTRRRDLMCEDLFGCDHTPETPIVDEGVIVSWVCRCGLIHPVNQAVTTIPVGEEKK
jgi:hypothetical protein